MSNQFESGSRFGSDGRPKQINPLTKRPYGWNPVEEKPKSKKSDKISDEPTSELEKDNTEFVKRITEIITNLKNKTGDLKELDEEFLELFKKMPSNLDDSVYDDIDNIKVLLLERHGGWSNLKND